MPCNNCGGATTMVDSTGGTTEGRFSEEYECANCGAKGYIKGEASEPAQNWTRSGGVFEDS